MQNCMVLASLGPTEFNASGSVTSLHNQTFSPQSVKLTSNFSVDLADPGFPNLALRVNKTISECLQQHCSNSNNCGVGDDFCNSAFYYTGNENYVGGYCYPDICLGNGSSFLNPDIGGIGVWRHSFHINWIALTNVESVYISYWTQTGIATILFILLKLCDALLYRICLFAYGILWPWWFLWPLGLETIKETANKAQTSLRRYKPAIQSATVEFHKAQCFFMLAIGVAGQIVLRRGSLEDGSLQSIINYTLVGIVSINGVLPVTLTLLPLHTVQMHSWYLLILSTCTVLLSTVTFFMSGKFTPSAQYLEKMQAATNDKYSNCGFKDPSNFCLSEGYTFSSTTSGAGGDESWAVIFSLVILGLLILDHVGLQEVPIVQRFSRWFFSRVESLLKLKPPTELKHSRLQRAFRNNIALDYMNALISFLYLFIWVWSATNICFFLFDLGSFSPVGGWTFGQVVAITVWAAPVFEFVKLLVQGLKAGLDYRTPFPYKIINSDKPDEEPDTDIENTTFRWTHPVRSGRGVLKRKLKEYFIPSGTPPEEVFKIF
ncbi:MAG: hypothetical protein ASARMPRED_006259 [Alectoria sarmentosa]|nr:MAG: hypothetical protein ASARMPRED_006259 [Alectoria sarmentosa]